MITGASSQSTASNVQSVSASPLVSKIRESVSATLEATKNLGGSDMVSFSDAAKKLFADKSLNDTELIQGLMDKAMETLRSRYTPASSLEKTYGLDTFNKKLGEFGDKLDDLMEKMRGAFQSNNTADIDRIGKEIAQLFKGLEDTVKTGTST